MRSFNYAPLKAMAILVWALWLVAASWAGSRDPPRFPRDVDDNE